MSDILIKGMEMPKNCLECPCFQFEWFDDYIDGCCNALKTKIENSHQYLPNCPVIEVPTPHGRLGDLDELKTAFPICDNSMDIKIASVRATINHAPTIIEAEGET